VGEQLESYSCEHSIVECVDVCQRSDVLMDSRLSSLDQVGSRLVVILAGALFYGTVTFQKKLVSNFLYL